MNLPCISTFEDLEIAYAEASPWNDAIRTGWTQMWISPSATLFQTVATYLYWGSHQSTWRWITQPTILGFSLLLHEVCELSHYVENGWNPFDVEQNSGHYDECHALALLKEYEFLRFTWMATNRVVPLAAFLKYNPLLVEDEFSTQANSVSPALTKEWDVLNDWDVVTRIYGGRALKKRFGRWKDLIPTCRVFDGYAAIGWDGPKCSPRICWPNCSHRKEVYV